MIALRVGERLPALIQTSAGALAVALGFVVLVGWQSANATLTQLRPGLPGMQYATALAFALAGVGLLSSVAARNSVAGIAGLLTAAIGALSLVQDLLGIDPQVDLLFGSLQHLALGLAEFSRMSPSESLCFTFAGSALFIRRAGGEARMSMATSLLGCATAALGLVAVIGYVSDLAPAYGWGRLTRMALHTAVGILIVGCGLVASGWRDAPSSHDAPHRVPTLVGVASLTVTIAIWHGLLVHDRERSSELIRTHASYLASIITAQIESQARTLEHMAHEFAPGTNARDRWEIESRGYLHQFDSSVALERIDSTTGQIWREPDIRLVPDTLRDHTLQLAAESGATAVTHAVDLPGNVQGFLIVVPLIAADAVHGGLVSTVRIDTLAGPALDGQEQFDYQAALFDGVRQIHGQAGEVADQWMTEVDVGARGVPFKLRVWPTPARAARLDGRLPSLILAGGLLLSAVLACMTFFAGTIRRREQQLRDAADQLREHVKEREQAQIAIAKARDAALESDRLKSEFVANVSHELRTPMNGILGLTDLLLDTSLSHEQRDHAVTVRECGETLLALLNDILDLSKVAAGKLDIQSVAFEFRRLVQQTCDLFTERARRKGVELVWLVHHDIPQTILGDPGRLRQVLTNLLGNAVKFTDHGEITVRATCETTAAGLMLRLEVSDTGIGISPESQEQIFQPFVQADGSITRRYGGTGLGLVISRQLAELMGGAMGMSSEPGKGSTFWFTIRTEAIAPSASLADFASVQHTNVLNGVRVLVLDDSEASRHNRRQLFESRHMIVETEPTSEAALASMAQARAKGEPFELVVADLRNVGTSVLAFAEAAHRQGFAPPARLILLTGQGQRGDAQRAQSLGACAYLTKPVEPADLLVCAATVMGMQTGRHATGSEPAILTRYMLPRRAAQPGRPLLVVEDNAVNQKVMLGFLAKLGYQADVATNGIEALEALDRTEYPIVFMDSQMPVLDGFATTAEIRRREGNTRRTTIVAVTAHAMTGERERCLGAGMDDYLSKPVSIERLRAVLERWVPASAVAVSSESKAERDGSETSKDTLDASVLSQLRALEADVPGLVNDVVTTFLRETPVRIDRLCAALAAADSQEAERAAHGLKGSAGAVGATRLSRIAGEIEERSRLADLAACRSSIAALESEFEQVRSELTALSHQPRADS